MHELDEIIRSLRGATIDSPRTVAVHPDAPDELWDLIWSRTEPVIRFEIFHGASVMSDSPAAALYLFDAGLGKAVVIMPDDPEIDIPITAFAEIDAGDWQRISELTGEIYERSRCAGEMPTAGSIPDRIHVHTSLDLGPLQRAVEAAIRRGCLDTRDMGVIVQRALDEPPSENHADLAGQYLRSTVRPMP